VIPQELRVFPTCCQWRRYSILRDTTLAGAGQGHTVPIDLVLPRMDPPKSRADNFRWIPANRISGQPSPGPLSRAKHCTRADFERFSEKHEN